MLYCPPNSTLDHIWIRHGVNICFLETVASSVVVGFVLLFGLGQLLFYRKYATRLPELAQISYNKLFKLQIACHVLLALLPILNIILRHAVTSEKPLYGFEILELLSAVFTWPICLAVIAVERHFQLPTPPSYGHGFVLLVTWTMAFVSENLAFLSMDNEEWWFQLKTLEHKVEFGFWVGRYVLTFVTFILGIKAPGIMALRDYYARHSDAEGFVREDGDGGEGTLPQSASSGSTWRNVWKKMRTLLPYIWPKKSVKLQLRVLACLLLLVGVRVTNVYVPLMSKKIVDSLAGTSTHGVAVFPVKAICLFILLKLLQGGGMGSQGLMDGFRSFLWIGIQQYTVREVQIGLFSHLHRLSLRWHLSRKIGEVLRIVDRGTDSINRLLEYIVFRITPTIVDIVIAIIYFTAAFNGWFGLIVFVTMLLYLAATVCFTEWRTKFRRTMNLMDNRQRTRAVDSLMNFETVKIYTGEQYEIREYRQTIESFQGEEWKTLATLTLLNLIQSFLINGGLLAGLLYCASLVSGGDKTVGDYVLFGTYIVQLMVPLNFLGTFYRAIQENFVNMENMFDLMDEPVDVVDAPNAGPLMALRGKVEFRNVSFSYSPERRVLDDVSFVAEPGRTLAIVGPTGSGKTTVIRLLLRLYDADEGLVLVDNQNVRDVTQTSLRRSVGVVPQDTVLFNDSIRSNIRYARMEASDGEVEGAARSADVHDRIAGFPHGYDTVVGERGLKLSGGEKQRVAIARTILKAPVVVLLDEATSALDSNTEKNIQAELRKVCAGRTVVIVAHRLSTVTHADCILVLDEGRIVERGSHLQLLEVGGLYATLWNQQSQTAADSDLEGDRKQQQARS